jgi:hypothetical protein
MMQLTKGGIEPSALYTWIGLAGLAFLAALLLWWATPLGIGSTPDSVVYLGVAQNLQRGAGLTLPFGDEVGTPLTHHAPLFPLVLSGLIALFAEGALTVARLGAMLFLAVNVLLLGGMVWLVTRQMWLTWVATAVGLLPVLLDLHLFVWSEPLFLALGFGGLVCLALYLQNGKRPYYWAAVVCLAMALLTRYAGITLVGTAGLLLLTWPTQPREKRMFDAVGLGLLTVMPLFIWLFTTPSNGSVANRQLTLHWVNRDHFWQWVFTVTDWLHVPPAFPGVVRVGFLAGLLLLAVVAVVLIWRRNPNWLRHGPPLISLLVTFVAIYLLFLLFSISFLDANTPLDGRILSPIWVAGVVLVAYVWAGLRAVVSRQRPFLAVSMVLVLGMVVVGGAVTHQQVSTARQTGLGFGRLLWQQSPLIAEAQQFWPGKTIYSNIPEAIYLYTGIPAQRLPRRILATTKQENPNFAAEQERLQQALQGEDAVIVLFTTARPAGYLAEVTTDLEAQLQAPLHPLFIAADGQILATARPIIE